MDYSRLRNGNDVRGVASAGVPGEEVNLTKTAAEHISRAFCLWLKSRLHKNRVLVAVGHDSRISAAELLSGVRAGVTQSGNDLFIHRSFFHALDVHALTGRRIFRRQRTPARRLDHAHRLASSFQPQRLEVFHQRERSGSRRRERNPFHRLKAFRIRQNR